MLPTLVLVYDNSPTLANIKNKVISNRWMRVVHLDSKVGLSLYSSSDKTPFIEGAIIFDEMGSRVATRRDNYSDLLALIEKSVAKIEKKEKALLKQWYQDQEESIKERYKKIPDLV